MKIFLAFGIFWWCYSLTAAPTEQQWRRQFVTVAAEHGISDAVIEEFANVPFHYRAHSSAAKQAEFQRTLWSYLETAAGSARVVQGNKHRTQHAALLKRIHHVTGVPASVVTAVWGLESNFGGYTGRVPVAGALAALAYSGKRQQFFADELLSLMRLVDRGDVASLAVTGSWAGGMGMVQFIPSTYLRYAVDFDGDGHRNLWRAPDALASAAHYLQALGWDAQIGWGREIQIPTDFDYSLTNGLSYERTLRDWSALGVLDGNGSALPSKDIPARLFVPAGRFGPKFALYRNFDVLRGYNTSDAYALAVGVLSDRIQGKAGVRSAWPSNARPLTTANVKALQKKLNYLGFAAGRIDGMLGQGTRAALQRYQQYTGVVADGFVTEQLYNQLMKEK